MESSMPGLWRYKSAGGCDGASDFTRVLLLTEEESIWGFDEDSKGNLYAGVYTLGRINNAKIFKSTNNGDSFFQIYDGGTYRHVHAIEVDTLTDYIYTAFADTNKTSVIRRSVDGGTNWEVLLEGIPQITAILATPTARLFGTDLSNMGRIYRTTDDFITTIVLDEWYQNCFFIRRNPISGHIYAGFKLDPSATSPLRAAIYTSKNDGITWEQLKTLENLAPGEGFWFASNFINNKIYVGWKSDGTYQKGIVITDEEQAE
ncbi:MAG: hypothetical protein C4560_07615 [Nitrospiraceae bacterium]|nr:MAG: hypothetical protein C4560_07615 [Nitrospiraceae bacterium]